MKNEKGNGKEKIKRERKNKEWKKKKKREKSILRGRLALEVNFTLRWVSLTQGFCFKSYAGYKRREIKARAA